MTEKDKLTAQLSLRCKTAKARQALFDKQYYALVVTDIEDFCSRVKVVYCRNCVYCETVGAVQSVCTCPNGNPGTLVADTDYCSAGKMRT